MDSLLNTTSQAKLSECSPIPAEESDANIDTQAPVSDQSPQKTTAGEHVRIKSSDQPIPLPDSSLQEQIKDDSAHTFDHAVTNSERSLTDSSQRFVAHDLINIQVKTSESSATGDHVLMHPDSCHQEHSTKDQTVVTSGQTASIDTSTLFSTTSDPYQVMLRCNDKLITALSLDPQGISRILLAKGLIPEHTDVQTQQSSGTSFQKATILVSTVRQMIKISPRQFYVFLDILSEQVWMKDIIEELKSYIGHEYLRRDTGVQAVSTGDHSSMDNDDHKSVSDISSNCEQKFPKLNSEDKAELEAQLILSADSMRKKFASLLLSVVHSLKRQGIDPRELATAILALTEYDDPAIGKPLLERDKDALMKAQTVDHAFDVLRPHMTFFNYEILEFLIEEMGSFNDKHKLQKFLQEFRRFCRRSVFEIPPNVLGHSAEKVVDQQKFCVKITKQFKAALLVQCSKQSEPTSQTISSTQFSSNYEDREKICAPELGISLEDAKHIQRKLASVLELKVSSIYLDSATSGSTILTFLLPSHISLAGLDSDPEVTALSSNGIHILCGPPGKPEAKELISNGLVVQWSQPEYGGSSLAKYILYYQKKCSETKSHSGWRKVELSSLETHTCVPNLCDVDTYVVKVCAVSDVGTLQYSDESDPIVISADGILTNNIHKVIVANKDLLTSAFSSADPNTIAVLLATKGVILKEDTAQISQASTPSEKATLLVTAIVRQIKSAPEKFYDFLNALSKAELLLSGDIVEILWSDYYDSVPVYKQYLKYLKFLYASLNKKQTSSDQWPPSVTMKFFRLAMINTATVEREYIDDEFVRMTITGKVDDILRQKYPIQLEDIFEDSRTEDEGKVITRNKRQRKVILLEGAPGCGKSTLSVYICQQWEKGHLFNQFKFVILIQLRDPAVKKAKGLADILPYHDTTKVQQIAGMMLATNCRDVLFILDGWDELPHDLRKNSIFHQLVQPKLPESNLLRKSTVIVTSRPIKSGDLHQLVTSRVEVLGFTAEKLYQFFTECLKGDTKAVKTLMERIEENPEVAGSCYLPLNATILVHLFKSDCNTLPTTLYGIFSSLVLNCIKRHLKLRTQYKDVSIESLDQLPDFAKKPLLVLCQLAYDGVMEDKIVFTSLSPDFNTLSLLRGVESFIGREKLVSYNFIHLSIQELLAAFYIATQLPASDQVLKFNELFDKNRFIAVFKFYAAITKLGTSGIEDVVIRTAKNRVLLVSLLHCLYEAQDPSLCKSVAQQLQYGLTLRLTTLTPSDCLCIGYFLGQVCKMAADTFNVNLKGCSIGDQGCKYLVSGLYKCLDTHSAVTTLLNMEMGNNAISHYGVHHLLKIGCINILNLDANDLLSQQDTVHATFDAFATELKNNATLKVLRLMECHLDSQSTEGLAEALTANKYLEQLILNENALYDDGIQHLAHALRVNQGLKELHLNECGMTDVGLECLAISLQHNQSLNELQLWNFGNKWPNIITEKIVPVLTKCLQNNHTLTKLVLPKNLLSYTTSIEKVINDVRKRSRLPHIKVSG